MARDKNPKPAPVEVAPVAIPETLEIPAILNLNIGASDAPIRLPLNLGKLLASKGIDAVVALLEEFGRNKVRDREAHAYPKDFDPESDPVKAAELWTADARKMLGRFESEGFVPRGSVRVNAFVVEARIRIAGSPAFRGKPKGHKVGGVTLAEVAKFSESKLRDYLGAENCAAIETTLAQRDRDLGGFTLPGEVEEVEESDESGDE